MWARIKTEQQLDSIHELDTLLRYTAAGTRPQELVGSTHAENYLVESIRGDDFTIQLQHDSRNVQSMLNAVFPTSVSKQSILQEGNWYHNADIDREGFF